ncbi:MAG TPA: TetR family transcriptional regulator [Pseudonocardiaceae bacterium]|jgi:AcrR family transcriptional regulator
MEPASEDLTARARIRDAALHLFAERGTDAATIRDIAATAGVSLGLVRHHFGSKEALRAACDEYVLVQSRRILVESTDPDGAPNPGFLPATHPARVLLGQYFARSMADGSPAATALFNDLVALAEQWITQTTPDRYDDPRAVAVLMTAMQLGPLLMHTQVSAALGVDLLSPAGHIRSTKALIDIYSQPGLSEDSAKAAKAAYSRLEEGETP